MAKKTVKIPDLTLDKAQLDFKRAYRAKSKLIKREKEDFLFAFGEQWSADDKKTLSGLGIKPITDNRIAPNLFLLTGLERQNRSDFAAFPVGEEDGIKAEIASALFKDAIEKSGYSYKSSEQFKDGITCGESHLELYLDNTDSLINAKPVWSKVDGSTLFPDPASREYDFSDAKFVYKLRVDIAKHDLINLYPEKAAEIEKAQGDRVDSATLGDNFHRQPKDYPTNGENSQGSDDEDRETFDLIERYYKKWVQKVFVGDKKTGQINEAETPEKAHLFISQYKDSITKDQQAYEDAVHQKVVEAHASMDPAMGTALAQNPTSIPDPQAVPPQAGPEEAGEPAPDAENPSENAGPGVPLTPDVHSQIQGMLKDNNALPPPPPAQDPERFILIKRMVPEIWCFAYVPGMEEELCDEQAWFFPKWKSYPFIPYFARFSTAPLTGEDRHLLIQGIVHGVKGSQEKHNKAEMLMLRHLNSTSNSGWLAEENVWVAPDEVKKFGSTPGVNLEYKQGRQIPQRIQPSELSTGHAAVSSEAAEAIKLQLGINADLLATQQSGTDSGRAIALRQKQGLLMVQELFDNLTRTRKIAGKFLLSQMSEIYDTESAKKVLGEAFLKKAFPPLMLQDPNNPENPPAPMKGADGSPMEYDKDMAELAIAEVLSGTLGDYDVSVGESVSSETERMATSAEVKDVAQLYPGVIPPNVLVEYTQLPETAKLEIQTAIAKAQEAAAAAAAKPTATPPQGAK